MRFTSESSASHRREKGTVRRKRELVRPLNVERWKILVWNIAEHYFAQKPESWGWSAKSFFEAPAAHAHLGTTTQRSLTSGTPPKAPRYDTPCGKEEENAFSMEGLRPPVSEPGEQIAEQLEG